MLNLLSGSYTATEIVIQLFALLVILFVAFPVHECAHGVTAKLLGDPTADESGRLTLNPFVHVDLFGAVAMLLFGIGWAKPVPVNPGKCTRMKPKGAMAVISAAGPLSNLLMSFIFMIIQKIVLYINAEQILNNPSDVSLYVVLALQTVITINVYLAVFNLLPIPPFDGSRIFLAFLPTKYYFKVMKYERYIMIGILVLLWTGILSIPLSYATQWLVSVLDFCTGFIEIIFGV